MIITAPSPTADRFLRPFEIIRSEHDRQLMICDWLRELADNKQIGPVIEEVDELLAYFNEELPLHLKDEEIDFFPILRRCCLPEDRFDSVLAQFELEHNVDRVLKIHVVIELKSITVDRTLENQSDLWANLRAFAEAQRRHIYWENQTLLPLGLKRLSRKDEIELGRNMAERRGLLLPY